MLCQLFLKPKDEVILPQFSFLMYRIYAKIIGAKVLYANEKNYKVSVIEILKKKSLSKSKDSSNFERSKKISKEINEILMQI